MRRKRLLLATGMVILALAALSRVPSGVFVLSPGRAAPVSPLISVEGSGGGAGRFLMTTISAEEPSATGLLMRAFDRTAVFVRRRDLLSNGRTIDEFLTDARRQMEESQAVATYVALRHAGLEAGLTGRGVRVLSVAGNSPVAGALRPGDVIVAAAGRPVSFEEEIRREVPAGKDTLTLTVKRDGRHQELTLSLKSKGDRLASGGSLLQGAETVTEGLETRFSLRVSFAAAEAAGPSAALAFALEVIDRLDPGRDLAGGRTVAATGAVWPSGRVVPVGGVRQKVLAARRAGADLILIPRANAAEARSAAGRMRVITVDTVAEAVDELLSSNR